MNKVMTGLMRLWDIHSFAQSCFSASNSVPRGHIVRVTIQLVHEINDRRINAPFGGLVFMLLQLLQLEYLLLIEIIII